MVEAVVKSRVELKMKPRFFFAEGVGKIGCAVGKEEVLKY